MIQITIQRTDLNCPLGLDLQLHITKAVFPALSEPGLRKLVSLSYLTVIYSFRNVGTFDAETSSISMTAAMDTLGNLILVPGGKPMIGPVPGLSNVFGSAGHEGEGLTLV
ncbi:hypothetical protein Tco_1463572 [Tanacetum coccineum]